jgi:hypothetical protein
MNNNDPEMEDYNMSLYEVCEAIGKSTRTISRYIRQGKLHPVGIKSRHGTLEYRFSRIEVAAVKEEEDRVRQFTFLPRPTGMPNPSVATFAAVNYREPITTPQAPFVIPGLNQRDFRNLPNETASAITANPPEPINSSQARQAIENQIEENKKIPEIKLKKNKTADTLNNDGQIITLLKETTEMLRGQLKVKDDQIKNLDDKIGQLIERNRETNILLKGLQDKMVLLEKPKAERKNQIRTELPIIPEQPSQMPVQNQNQLAGEEIQPSAPPAPRPILAQENLADEISQREALLGAKPQSKNFFGKIFK